MKNPSTAREPDFFSWRNWLFLFAMGALLVALRTPWDWLHPGFYAEDGMIFYRDEVVEGWRACFHTYNGYFHFFPRLAALAASTVAPVSFQPLLYAMLSAVAQSLAASFFFLPENRFFVRSDALRWLVCVLTLVDYQASEMLGNVMIVQWFLFPVALLMLCLTAPGAGPLPRHRIPFYCLAMAAICLTAPLLVVFVPLALFFLIRSRGPARLVPAIMIAAVAVQGIAFLLTPAQTPSGLTFNLSTVSRAAVATVGAWVYRVLITEILGESAAKFLAFRLGEIFAAVAFAVFVAALYYASRNLPRTRRILALSGVAVSVALVGISLTVRNMLPFFGDLTHYTFFGGGARYFFVSSWILLVVAAMLADAWGPRPPGLPQAALLLAFFVFGAVGNFQGEELPDAHWADYAPAIEQWQKLRDRNMPRPHVNAPINPAPFSVDLPAQ